MPFVYVARSPGLMKWGSDVGLSKHLYKLGAAEESAEAGIEALNAAQFAGQDDWRLVRKQAVDAAHEPALVASLARKETMVDPKYYPRIKGAQGIFKVKLANVESSMLVAKALAGEEEKLAKLRPEDIAAYLIQNALE